MNKLLSFVKLDIITIKPYFTWKTLLIMLAVTVSLSFNESQNGLIIGFIMVLALTFSSYPFAVGEKNGIDALYATLPVKRNCVVLGRYLFALILDIAIGLLAVIISASLQLIMKNTFNLKESFFIMLILLVSYSIFQAIQLPIYFKLGYAKAKLLAYLPVLVFPLLVLSTASFFKESIISLFIWVMENQMLTAIISAALWAVIVIISYKISLKFYMKRSF